MNKENFDEILACEHKPLKEGYAVQNIDEKNQKVIDEAMCLLTKKESLIFQEMIQGKSNAEIGKILNISKHSVEVYVTTIYEKTFCDNRTEFLSKYRFNK